MTYEDAQRAKGQHGGKKKKPEETRRTVSQKVDNVNKEKILKKDGTNSGAEKCINWKVL